MQHIAFDLGEVIMHVDFSSFFEVLMGLGIEEDDIWEFIWDYEYTHNVGILALPQALRQRFPETFAGGKIKKWMPSLLAAWNKSVYPNSTMMNFVINLKNEGVKVAFLSNIGREHAYHLRTTYPDFFNGTIQHFSFEVGAAKPQVLYFQSFLLSNEDFAGCVFLDDRKENIVAAAKQKFDAVHFSLEDMTPMDIKKSIRKIQERLKKGW